MTMAFVKTFGTTWLLCGAVACSNSKPEVATGSDGAKKDATDAEDGKDVEDGGETFGDDGGGANFSGCGVNSYAEAKSFSQQTSSANIPYHGSSGVIFSSEYTIQVKGTVGFQVGDGKVNLTNDFAIISASPPNAADKAKEELKKAIGQRTAEILDASAWEAAAEAWGGVTCGVIPVAKITEQTQAHQTVVTFDPPLPYFVSPVMTKARFEKEFPEQRTFAGIKATIVQTTNPKAQTGQTFTGTAYVRPIAGDTMIVENDGTQVKVDADYAYRLDFDFGSFEATAALGLNKLSTFYVKDGKFFAVSIETGITQAPSIHYVK